MSAPLLQSIEEYRGVTDLVAAEILCDDNSSEAGHGYVCDTPFAVAGVASLTKTTESSSETHYYNNGPAVVVTGTGADTLTIECSALDPAVEAKLTGQIYDSTLKAFIEGARTPKYFAFGYKTMKTDGTETYVWRYKCAVTPPDRTHATINAGTDANGQTLTITGIMTTHVFSAADNKGVKGMNVDLGSADVSAFFDAVTTPDDLHSLTSYTLTLTKSGAAAYATVKRNGVTLTNGATIYAGDRLEITFDSATTNCEVDGNTWNTGDIHIVVGNTTVATDPAE